MKNVFETSLFWILVFVVGVSYLKLFNAPLGMDVANRLATAPVSVTQLTDVQSSIDSGLNVIQATQEQLQVSLDAISTKLGIPLQPQMSGAVAQTTDGNGAIEVSGSAVIVPSTAEVTTVKAPSPTVPSKVLKK